MSAEQTPDIERVLAEYGMLLALGACRCGARWTAADDFGNASQFRRHAAQALAPVLAAAVREAKEAAWDEGERHESEYLATWGQFCPGRDCNPYRAGEPDRPRWMAFPGKVPVCQDCGVDWEPVRRGECGTCGSDAGPLRADRVAEPQHEAATSGKESEASDEQGAGV